MSAPVDQTPAEGQASSPARRLVGALAAILLIAVLVLGSVRFFVPTIASTQQQPPGHFFEPCVTCHLVVDDAKVIDVE